MSLLEIIGLGIEAGGRRIVDGIDLRLEAGEVLGVIGESGASKSTLGLAALGYVRPGARRVAGAVRFEGRDVFDLPASELRALRRGRVAYVAQSAAAAFNPAIRLADQVLEVPRLVGRGDLRLAHDLFDRLELPEPEEFGRRYPHQVSGGQLQRAMLAMALANDPALVVLDEPTTALDVTTQLEVLRVVRDAIRTRRVAAIYISHDLAVVAQLADRIAVLRDGLLVEEGPVRSLIDAPKTPYARALIGLRHAEGAETAGTNATIGPPVLSVKGVTAGYGSGPAVVKDASLDIAPGRVLAVVGQSGSGKSTLARAIMGLAAPRLGGVTLRGESLPPLTRRTRDQRRRLQLVQQSPDVALNPHQSVGEIIGRPLKFFHDLGSVEAARRVRGLLEAVELSPTLADRRPATLSGGQKQRVCIARALAAEPDVLVCDEITSALDLLVEDAVVTMLRRIQAERGLAVLFITHNLWLARRFAHEVAVMQHGRIVESGPAAAVLGAPRHDYTKGLLAAVPTLDYGWLDRKLA